MQRTMFSGGSMPLANAQRRKKRQGTSNYVGGEDDGEWEGGRRKEEEEEELCPAQIAAFQYEARAS